MINHAVEAARDRCGGTVAALLPDEELAAIRQALDDVEVLACASLDALARIVQSERPVYAVMDPLHACPRDLAPAMAFVRKFRNTPVVAYVALTPQNLHAVVKLASEGLQDAFLHPLRDSGWRLRKFHDRLRFDELANQFLALLEPSLAHLHPNIVAAIIDLFQRPGRYSTAADLAAQAGLSTRHLERTLSCCRLGTPRKLVVAAKIIRAYAFLREPGSCVEDVSDKLGYETVRILARQTRQIFRCAPSRLRSQPDGDEVLRNLLEWVQKPCGPECPYQSLTDLLIFAPSRWGDARVSLA
jgi:AraC-like DNA-binding protein